jgi:hypothetical protein
VSSKKFFLALLFMNYNKNFDREELRSLLFEETKLMFKTFQYDSFGVLTEEQVAEYQRGHCLQQAKFLQQHLLDNGIHSHLKAVNVRIRGIFPSATNHTVLLVAHKNKRNATDTAVFVVDPTLQFPAPWLVSLYQPPQNHEVIRNNAITQ